MEIPKVDKAKIIRLREERGLSTKEAARQMGISAPHLSMLETGQAGIGLRAFIRFCLFYDVQLTDLLEFPTGSKIKRANGKTYEVQPDGSFQRWSPPLEKNWPAH